MPARPEGTRTTDFTQETSPEARSTSRDVPRRLIHSPAETQVLLNISHASVYRLIKSGRLKKVKVGARSGITRESIEAVALASLDARNPRFRRC